LINIALVKKGLSALSDFLIDVLPLGLATASSMSMRTGNKIDAFIGKTGI
jgi:hypothetical protein